MKKRKSKKRKEYFIIFFISLILFIFSIWLWTARPLKVETLNIEFEVGKTFGVTVDTNELNFGRVTPGSSITRNIIIDNTYEEPIRTKILATKNIVDFLFVDSDFIMLPGNKTKIPLTLKIPEDASFGNYKGKIKFEFRAKKDL